jgi:sulfotransferase family protein
VSAGKTLATRARDATAWRLRRLDERTRIATASRRLRPNYLVIGAQKGGTTSLHGYLAAHPAVLTASIKEVQYFSKYYARGEDWYLAYFPLAARGRLTRLRTGVAPAVGEASATYLFDPRTPERVRRFDPQMKLIAALRDPVERAYSHYQMEQRWGRETLPFEQALEREEAELGFELERVLADPDSESGLECSYVARGRYAEQLDRWLEHFPREQLLVVTSDELLEQPGAVMTRVAQFLGITDWRAPSYPLRGVREYSTMPPETRERLARIFEPHNRRLEQLLGRELAWTRPGTA